MIFMSGGAIMNQQKRVCPLVLQVSSKVLHIRGVILVVVL